MTASLVVQQLGTLWMVASIGVCEASVHLARGQQLLRTSKIDHASQEGTSTVTESPTPKMDSTANPEMCNFFYVLLMTFIVMQIVGWCMKNDDISRGAYLGQLVCGIIATCYAAYHGLGMAFYEGGHDLTSNCRFVAIIALCHYILFGIGIIFLCCFTTAAAGNMIVTSMEEERQKKEAALMAAKSEASREKSFKEIQYINSKEFKTKCMKAFGDADKDGNGKLDLAEIREAVLFDMTEEQKLKAQKEALFQRAFYECDKNSDSFIDQDEFIEVIKYVRVSVLDGE